MKFFNTQTPLLIATAFATAVGSAGAAAKIEDAAVSYDLDKGIYQLQWQSDTPVDVQITGDKGGRTIARAVRDGQLQWSDEHDHRHYFTLKGSDGESVTLASRVLPLEGGRNFRDLGGYRTTDGKTVKWGKLFRSGVLHNLTADDYAYLQPLGIKAVVDFRTTEERRQEPTLWKAGEIDHLTWDYSMGDMQGQFAKVLAKPDFSEGDIEQLMHGMYTSLVREQTPHYRAMFAHLIDGDAPMVFHCTAGKDRTGIGAALLLTALGVDRKTVVADYTLTESVLDADSLMQPPQDASDKDKATFAFFAKLPAPVRKALMGARPDYIEAAFAEMERESGSVDNFIRDKLDVDARELAQLRVTYLQ